MNMFCFQCQEAANGTGCTMKGVCGKEASTSGLMDILLYAVRGEAIVNQLLREKGEACEIASVQMIDALFCTITNANFDDDAIKERIDKALAMKKELIALALQKAFGLESVNDLPIVYNIAWYEQKAVIVLLALLSLGVKNINLGPTLPSFLSPNVANVLVEKFGIGAISTVEEDLREWIL